MTPERITILLADDHDMVRAGIRSVLAECDEFDTVAEVEDGLAAVREVARLRPRLAILDVAMPGLNGVAAAEQIRSLGLGTTVIALSMHTERQFIAGMLGAGARGYLLKNTAARELNQAIRVVIAGGTYLSPKAAEVMENPAPAGPAAALTEREREVLQLVAEGRSNKEIADALFLGTRTVETYRAQLMDKLNIRGTAGLIKYALRHGVATLE